ncbi:TPA: molybdopterin-guanine dinucleotide biosynthesis protein B, partial [Serratia fonticola]|nr:molybdopterin-guanine dinucleotide biosynthesis protein B [Serratia fonticola]
MVEGFKDESVPKIALCRRGAKGEEADLLDELVIALVSDEKLAIDYPLLDIN